MPTKVLLAPPSRACGPSIAVSTVTPNASTVDGETGGTAQKVGGPFDKDGIVGQNVREDGVVGGTAHEAAETAQGEKPSAFDKGGVVGKHFTSHAWR
jgi:hypothetical protein